MLLEHHWAGPLRDALMRAGDVFVSPFDLVDIGLATRQEAEQTHNLEML